MKKHFFKRLLTVIIAFIAIFFFVVFLTRQSEGDAMSKGMTKAFLVLFFIFFYIVAVVLGLMLDSIILYRKKEEDKVKANLFVLFIFILFMTCFLAFLLR